MYLNTLTRKVGKWVGLVVLALVVTVLLGSTSTPGQPLGSPPGPLDYFLFDVTGSASYSWSFPSPGQVRVTVNCSGTTSTYPVVDYIYTRTTCYLNSQYVIRTGSCSNCSSKTVYASITRTYYTPVCVQGKVSVYGEARDGLDFDSGTYTKTLDRICFY